MWICLKFSSGYQKWSGYRTLIFAPSDSKLLYDLCCQIVNLFNHQYVNICVDWEHRVSTSGFFIENTFTLKEDLIFIIGKHIISLLPVTCLPILVFQFMLAYRNWYVVIFMNNCVEQLFLYWPSSAAFLVAKYLTILQILSCHLIISVLFCKRAAAPCCSNFSMHVI